jgi:hypothetical protein
MAAAWRKLTDRVFGPAVEPGAGGAGVQLWWQLPAGPVTVISAVIEVLQPPVRGRRYAWGLQADGSVAALVAEDGSCRWELPGGVVASASFAGGLVQALAADGDVRWSAGGVESRSAGDLFEPAVTLELAQPPDDPTTVARWSSLRIGDDAVPAVLLTLPTTTPWRRLDVVPDEHGLLLVTNTHRTAKNLSVLRAPPAR